MLNSIQITGNSSHKSNFTTDMVLAGGYYSRSNGNHTLVVYTGNHFMGKIILEGTLEHEPHELADDSNWFTINLNDKDSIEFPIYDEHMNIISNEKVYSYKFTCLPVYIRCKIDRTNIENWETLSPELLGNIRKIVLTF